MLVKDLEFVKEVLPFWNDLNAEEKKYMQEKLVDKCYLEGQIIHDGEDCTGLLLVKAANCEYSYCLSPARRLPSSACLSMMSAFFLLPA